MQFCSSWMIQLAIALSCRVSSSNELARSCKMRTLAAGDFLERGKREELVMEWGGRRRWPDCRRSPLLRRLRAAAPAGSPKGRSGGVDLGCAASGRRPLVPSRLLMPPATGQHTFCRLPPLYLIFSKLVLILRLASPFVSLGFVCFLVKIGSANLKYTGKWVVCFFMNLKCFAICSANECGCFSLTCWMNSIKLSICHASVAGKNDHQWSSVYCIRYVLVPCRYLVAKYLPMLIYNASVKLKFCLKEP